MAMFSGLAARALSQGAIDWAAQQQAEDQIAGGWHDADRRKREAALLQTGGLAPKRAVLPVNSDMPGPLAVAGQKANYNVGTSYAPPTVGIVPPGGAAPAAPAAPVDPAASAQASTVATAVVDPLDITVKQWDSMTPAQQASHLDKVNRNRAIADSRNKAGGILARSPPAQLGDVSIEGTKFIANLGIAGFNAIGADKLAGMDAPAEPFKTRTFPITTALSNIGGVGGKPLTAAEYAKTLRKTPPSTFAKGAVPAASAVPMTVRAQKLVPQLAAAVQSPKGMKLQEYARAIGVDPRTAVTHWGMESSFGANPDIMTYAQAKKSRGAYGAMQVVPSTIEGTMAHFAKPAVIAKYPNEANNINALIQMVQADPDSEDGQFAAGILQMKYIQDIGMTDQSLQGAAYHGNPHEVMKKGAPVNASDGNITNGDHNTSWNSLFSQTAELGGGASTATSSPAPQATAPQAGVIQPTGNKSFDSRVKFATQKAPAEYDFQTQQLMQSRERHIQLLQQQQQMFEQEREQVEFAYTNANQRFMAHKAAGDVVGMTAAMDELASAQKLGQDLNSRTTQFSLAAQSGVDAYNDQLIVNESDRAIRDLANGDPTRASSLLSQAGGDQVVFQPRTDGGYVKIKPDGTYVLGDDGNAKKFTNEDVMYEVVSVADKATAAAINAGRASSDSKAYDSKLKSEEEAFKITGELAKIKVQSIYDYEKELMKLSGDHTVQKDELTGGFKMFYKGPEGKVVTISPDAVQATINGTTITPPSVKVDFTGVQARG